MLAYENGTVAERALEKAAKIICGLKCGLCPISEELFQGCPQVCDEQVRPWRCWVFHLRGLSVTVREG